MGVNEPVERQGSRTGSYRRVGRKRRANTGPSAHCLLLHHRVRVLQARFHFFPDYSHEPLVVAHLVWNAETVDACPTVQPSDALMRQQWPTTILSKLQYLVAVTTPDSFRRLQGLNSRFWSFVDVSSVTTGPARVALVPFNK